MVIVVLSLRVEKSTAGRHIYDVVNALFREIRVVKFVSKDQSMCWVPEYGAVKVVSGNLAGQTQTATLVVEEKYANFAYAQAYATAFLLAAIAVACLVVVSLLRPRVEGTPK